ncbi:hypothetical protein BDC45DRAFT_496046 [Circinella umbellata]|nr:hypothetical protein BDC45DRAFT_496037 [Circinella umbellata]KAI7859424.1 hypothetical protein BDC45DRAFT_496046 [Circinella umbellata]
MAMVRPNYWVLWSPSSYIYPQYVSVLIWREYSCFFIINLYRIYKLVFYNFQEFY